MIKNKKRSNITAKREKQTRYLSQAIQLEEAVNPHIIRATMTMVSLALLAFIAWASLTNINEVARTPGEIVPQGYQQTVQHLEGGIVKTINVHEGDVVEKGQILILLDDAAIKEDLERAQIKQINLEMQEERLRAFSEKREPDFSRFAEVNEHIINDQKTFFAGMRNAREKEIAVIEDQIKERKNNIQALQSQLAITQSNAEIAKDIYNKRQQLNAKGYASDMQLLADERALNEALGKVQTIKSDIITARTQIDEYEDRHASLSAGHVDAVFERLSAIATEKAQNTEIIQKIEERISRLSIKAPSRGLVKGLSINTIGGIIQPGQLLMEIIPLDKNLEVAVKISPQDIGHLKVGQPVQVKFSTYDFSRYGSLDGKLDHISATTFSGPQNERYYQGRITLAQNYVGKNRENVILPGMTVMADIVTGDKTILQYMLKPIHISLKTAFTER